MNMSPKKIKYQVFVSSTYEDLIEERKAVSQAILEADCIPAGMELFPASDEPQWALIKKVIDDSDIYLVITAGRYGTIDTDETGKKISYTEMEYEYAVKTGKPILAFIHEDIGSLPNRKCDNTEGISKLKQFNDRLSNSRVRKTWVNTDNLKSKVLLALNYMRNNNADKMSGWVKANESEPTGMSDNGRILNRHQVIEFEGNVKGGSRIIILSSRFCLDSEMELINTISNNILKGCRYQYIIANDDRDEFLLVCSRWWNRFIGDLLAHSEQQLTVSSCSKECREIIVSSRDCPYFETIHKAKQYFINHIEAYEYDFAFVPTTIAIYEKDVAGNGQYPDTYDVLIPLPSRNDYCAYLIPSQEIQVIRETVKRANGLCKAENKVRIVEEDLAYE